MPSKYPEEFGDWRDYCDVAETEDGTETVYIDDYNTVYNENRFIIGCYDPETQMLERTETMII